MQVVTYRTGVASNLLAFLSECIHALVRALTPAPESDAEWHARQW